MLFWARANDISKQMLTSQAAFGRLAAGGLRL
jgi:hypothetical protein